MTQTRSGWGNKAELASRLKERITLETPVETPDGQGGMVRSWATYAQCFAEVTALSLDGGERIDAAREVMRLAYRIVLRARTDVTTRMRVVWKGRQLNIRLVIPGDASLELLVEEGVAL